MCSKTILCFLKLGIKLSKKCHEGFWKPTKKQTIKRITAICATLYDFPRTVKHSTFTTIHWVSWLQESISIFNCRDWGKAGGGTDSTSEKGISDTLVYRKNVHNCPNHTWLKRCSKQLCSLSCFSWEIRTLRGSSSPRYQKKKIFFYSYL